MTVTAAAHGLFRTFPARDYDLHATLNSGQAFRWCATEQGWTAIVAGRWVSLRQEGDSIRAATAQPISDWSWLQTYLQLEVELGEILGCFPDDEPMRAAVRACRGLRLLRQEPWECLASFILSSTKQIVQIRQIVAALSQRLGDRVPTPPGADPGFSFPSAARVAAATELELRGCKMGFRAPYLRETAQAVATGQFDLDRLSGLTADGARHELLTLPGVGPKIADCVLLFAYGFQTAFPVDVWVMKALRRLYFPKRRVTKARLLRFTGAHFGPHAGYAQQYLFHYMRMHSTESTRRGEGQAPLRVREANPARKPLQKAAVQ